MVEGENDERNAGRIEGGIDAIVLGASADGLAAAAYLGEAGLRTVLLEAGAEIGGEIRAREFAPDMTCIDGDHLISMLDPETISDLDLYRRGVAYASRRMNTAYFFDDGQSLEIEGDLINAAASIDEEIGGGVAFQKFTQQFMELATQLRPAFEASGGGRGRQRQRALAKAMDVSPSTARQLNRYLLSSGEAILDDYLPDGMLKTAMLTEIAFRSAAPAHEPFSFMNLIRRWAGETSGLQAAIAYPRGGAVTVIDALRRAVQAAKVEIRAATPVQKILIERDCVAGVQLENGGQIRAPIVIAAMDARRVFLDMIGASHIDIEFQRAVSAARPPVGSGRLHLVLKGFARDEKTKENMQRRLVYTPGADNLRRAFAAARAGEIPQDMIIEAIFPAAVDEAVDDDSRQLLSIIAHPLPIEVDAGPERREAIASAIQANVERFAPDIVDRIEASDLSLPADLAANSGYHVEAFAGRPGVMQQWALAGQVTTASGIEGLYFCGPEAQIGYGVNCAAGRIAAKAAIRLSRRGAAAA